MQETIDASDNACLKGKVLFSDNYSDPLARAGIYRFLATLFLEAPTREVYDCLFSPGFVKDLRLMLDESVAIELESLHIPSDDELMALRQEYMDLFVIPTGYYVAPFEDVYRGQRQDGNQERGPLLGDRAVSVKTFYRAAGANLESTCKELPTHIGIELLFMSFLCEQEANSRDHVGDEEVGSTVEEVLDGKEAVAAIYRQWQIKFLHEHITDWFPQLDEAIGKNARSSFYRIVSKISSVFLNVDKDYLLKQVKQDYKDVNQYSKDYSQTGVGQ